VVKGRQALDSCVMADLDLPYLPILVIR
jgi:hypothetical protein